MLHLPEIAPEVPHQSGEEERREKPKNGCQLQVSNSPVTKEVEEAAAQKAADELIAEEDSKRNKSLMNAQSKAKKNRSTRCNFTSLQLNWVPQMLYAISKEAPECLLLGNAGTKID